jgi:hypothetical protein
MSREIKYECGIPLYANSKSDEFPTKEEIEADLHKRTRELFPEKPEDYVPTALEVVERLAKMEEEAGVKIGH